MPAACSNACWLTPGSRAAPACIDRRPAAPGCITTLKTLIIATVLLPTLAVAQRSQQLCVLSDRTNFFHGMLRLRNSRQMLRQTIITSKTANAIAVANTVMIVANERTYMPAAVLTFILHLFAALVEEERAMIATR